MTKYVFLLKTNENDRDCVKYLSLETGKFECDHYFAGVRISGACFSGFEKEISEMNFDDFETILTKEELQRLFDFDSKISELKYGIVKGDERYNEGVRLRSEIEDIFDKLQSEENMSLFEKIQKEEKEYLKNEYDLDDEDIECIFDNYYLDYRDRGIVGNIYKDIEEASYEEAEHYDFFNGEHAKRYFDYEKFGEDLLDGERYLELPSGRIAYLNY